MKCDTQQLNERIYINLILLFIILSSSTQAIAAVKFNFVSPTRKVSIVYAADNNKLDSITAFLLANDIESVTGYRPQVTNNIAVVSGDVIIIGTLHSRLIQSLKDAYAKEIEGKWECYSRKVINKPLKNIDQALVIVGSDSRGAAYGVFDLSESIGISPWYWWADVHPKKTKTLALDIIPFTSSPPSVKYRGIFLNDEDWGLRPWASKTFEPEVGNIGPKTYAKIFELLLRLKANMIWPAMHEGTTAFFKISGNAVVAADYQIVVGTSHAEPMLRNNVDEWKENSMGHFNYVSNRKNIYKYWEDRVKESKEIDAIYTIGMRGIHDSKMEGVKDNKEGSALLKNIIADQRKLIETYINPDATKVKQAFTVYKEVLDLYNEGLKIPEDITLVWTDDNYGYIRRLSNAEEQKRSGGGGIYYHASYWGRPHDYLWVDSVHPSLLREEMMKAYDANCKEIWVLNVGDLKSIEYSTQLFLDMAYDAPSFADPNYLKVHMNHFYSLIFGNAYGQSIADMKWEYFDMAFERKPEFMGWSQTEPSTETKSTAYSSFLFGDENTTRINKYQNLENKASSLKDKLSNDMLDSYFQLVYYPTKAASLMNKKFLYADKANIYGKQGRLSAKDDALKSKNAFDEIKSITQEYNQISNGKWNYMIDMSPRDLPVFHLPKIEIPILENNVDTVGILFEGETTSGTKDGQLPIYYQNLAASHFIDLFLKKDAVVSWVLLDTPNWIKVNKKSGVLDTKGINTERIQIRIDWNEWKKNPVQKAQFSINYGDKVKVVNLTIDSESPVGDKKYFKAMADRVVIYAQNFTSIKNQGSYQWKKIDGLGYSKAAMQAYPLNTDASLNTEHLEKAAPYLEYQIQLDHLSTNLSSEIMLYAIPTHPLSNQGAVRVGVQWNDDPIQIVDFRTFDRSEEWKQNVLSNKATKKVAIKSMISGVNTLKIYMIDKGVALDYFYINLNKNNSLPYSILPETTQN